MLNEGLIVWLQKTSTTMTINIKIIMIIIKKMKMKIMTNKTTTKPVARLTASQKSGEGIIILNEIIRGTSKY